MDAELRAELEEMLEADQAVRIEAMRAVKEHGIASPQYEKVREKGLAADARHKARMIEVLEEHGWPGRGLVGDKASHGAFLVLQHSDLAVQKKYMPLLEAAVAAGEAEAADLALLEDRVRMQEGRDQLYGSQLTRGADGKPTLWPIEDEARVDERRASVGLEPLSDYLRRFGL